MNLDVKNQMLEDIKNSKDVSELTENFANYAKEIENQVRKEYEELKECNDAAILAQRGVFALTNDEKKFYDALVSNIKNQSVTGLENTMPITIFDRIFDELATRHPLLSKVEMQNLRTITGRIIVNTGLSGVAGWGELCSTIDDEIESGFAFRPLTLHKLSAFMEVCKTFVDLGYEWLDRYVRLCLAEAIATALEDAILNGTGSNMPLGLIKEIADAGATQTIPATSKSKVTVNKLDAATLGSIAATLTKGGARDLARMVMVVNPSDYYSKVIPAVRFMNVNGEYKEFLPFPMDIITSTKVAANDAVIFNEMGYFVGVGLDGKVEKSNEYKFYEDLVCYKIKTVADGTPKDNNQAVYCDITNLVPAFPSVAIDGVVKTKEQE